jgi:hypothetical protein
MVKRFVIAQSNQEFYTSHSGLALVGLCVNKLCSLPAQARQAFPVNAGNNGIGTDDILRSYIGLLTLGQSDYEAITNRRQDEYFKEALGIGKIPSAETLRQRLDGAASGLRPLVNDCTGEFLKNARIPITALPTGHVALDCDVFAMDNSQTQKEGVSRIYNGEDGYAPIAAYLGQEGWCLELELREGKQHSQCQFIPFLKRVVTRARSLTSQKLLVRLDSAHDALETRATLSGFDKVSYILKWNPRKEDQRQWAAKIFAEGEVMIPREGKRVGLLSIRIEQTYEGKTYQFRRVMRAIERTIDKKGQLLLIPQIELEGWWTSLDVCEQEAIRLYEDHGTSEQFHSEIKSDMDLERLPSGKFATNSLILTLAGLAYNILRMIGQLGLLGEVSPMRHPAKRRRLKTVIQELMYLAARLIKTGHRLKLLFSRHCPAFAAFQSVYGQLTCS